LSAFNRYHPRRRRVNGTAARNGGEIMSTNETIVVETPVVACDGGNDALGHPRVFLTMGEDRQVVCPYCSRHYVLKEGAEVAAAH
jgi:uncharacterized Zn-finger protein